MKKQAEKKFNNFLENYTKNSRPGKPKPKEKYTSSPSKIKKLETAFKEKNE